MDILLGSGPNVFTKSIHDFSQAMLTQVHVNFNLIIGYFEVTYFKKNYYLVYNSTLNALFLDYEEGVACPQELRVFSL